MYTEEAGHALDQIINQGKDAEGDEGALFQKTLLGEKLGATEIAKLKAENDHGVLQGKGG